MLRAIGLPELMVIGAVAVLLFGGRRVGELGKGLGEAIRSFKGVTKEAKEAESELKKVA